MIADTTEGDPVRSGVGDLLSIPISHLPSEEGLCTLKIKGILSMLLYIEGTKIREKVECTHNLGPSISKWSWNPAIAALLKFL